ncbi:histidine phosphatase family protein [Aspergillus affinis]|uniref:histidine phosphatase family protein n=1 Tax=Aspergillus affinis TaxID=1070780 RepID=UPI0022FF3C62|nr:multiple inositol polyphosphate phosphatase [Aspergillus affinis]KAI9045878.1 multiple inositol polyphosphate phosphatase [Aspergillus affinis]
MSPFLSSSVPLSALALFAISSTAIPTPSPVNPAAPTGLTFPSGFDIVSSWANLAPWSEVPSFNNISKGVPRGCELSQAHVLHRHAQRYPTSFKLDGGGIDAFNEKLSNYSRAHNTTEIASGPLRFLNDWVDLVGKDTLLPTGAATEASSGARIWSRYGRFLYRGGSNGPEPGVERWNSSLNVYPNGTERPKPIFRTTTQGRILESARWWLSGFFDNEGANSSYSEYDLVVIPEGDGYNNTLGSDHSCENSPSGGNTDGAHFISTFTQSAVTRLSPYMPADFNLTAFDIASMMVLCPYEYATTAQHSSFCTLFTEQEWLDYAYAIDIQFYGVFGPGSPTGRAQGIGYILELAARLQGKTIPTSDTSINATWDQSSETFPLNQPLYMDMSHDTVIVAVLAALGLKYFNYGPHGLPANVSHEVERTFHLNQVTPFGANIVTEVWTCPSDGDGASFETENLAGSMYRNPDLSETDHTKDFLRFVLNGAPVPLDGLVGCEDAVNGFCDVDEFLGGVEALKEDAEYQFACFGEYELDKQVGDGRPEV